jgi:hypothetical protein
MSATLNVSDGDNPSFQGLKEIRFDATASVGSIRLDNENWVLEVPTPGDSGSHTIKVGDKSYGLTDKAVTSGGPPAGKVQLSNVTNVVFYYG